MLPCRTFRQRFLRAARLSLQTAGRVIANVEGSFSRYALPLLLRLLGPNDGLVAANDGLVRAYYRLLAANNK